MYPDYNTNKSFTAETCLAPSTEKIPSCITKSLILRKNLFFPKELTLVRENKVKKNSLQRHQCLSLVTTELADEQYSLTFLGNIKSHLNIMKYL